jgi:hypothetical protein
MTQAHRNASSLFQRSALWAALSLSVFGSAQALTLSRPIVQSKQGEALRAEVDISEITPAEQIELQADLASPEIYKAAKIEIPVSQGAPVDIQVQLLRRDNARPYLKITSKQPIYGNTVDLLIDLRWATGRMLRDFSRENPFLVIKGGIYEGKAVTKEEVMQLANLESREVLLAKLAGAMKGSIAKAARVFDALRIKLESGAPTEVAASVDVVAPVEVVAEAVAEAAPVVEEVVAPEPVIENNKEEA